MNHKTIGTLALAAVLGACSATPSPNSRRRSPTPWRSRSCSQACGDDISPTGAEEGVTLHRGHTDWTMLVPTGRGMAGPRLAGEDEGVRRIVRSRKPPALYSKPAAWSIIAHAFDACSKGSRLE